MDNTKSVFIEVVGVLVVALVSASLLITGNAEASEASSTEKVAMISGQTELLRNLEVDRISIGDPNIVDIEVLGESSEILIQALSPGVTDLRLWKDGVVKTIIIDVGSPAAHKNIEMVRIALGGIEGISIRPMGERVLVEGTIFNDADLAKITQVSEAFENVLVMATKSTIDLQNIVSLDVKFVEARKNVLKEFGVDWDDFAEGFVYGTVRNFVANDIFALPTSLGVPLTPDVPNDLSFNTFGIASRVNSVINMLASNGYARLLAEPRLSCVSGSECEFLAGGEVPIPIETEDTISVSFKQYGVILNILPTADSIGNIDANIEVEVSSIDPSTSVRGIPGFLTRRTSTRTNVKDGETIILSGMVSNESSKNVDRVPGLGNIPIIGELFKSRQFRDNNTELLVFVTPTLIKPSSKANTESIQRLEEINKEFDDKLKLKLMD